MRKSIKFEDETEEAVDKYRRATPSGKPIPSFTKAVNDLVKIGAKKELRGG